MAILTLRPTHRAAAVIKLGARRQMIAMIKLKSSVIGSTYTVGVHGLSSVNETWLIC